MEIVEERAVKKGNLRKMELILDIQIDVYKRKDCLNLGIDVKDKKKKELRRKDKKKVRLQ